MPSRFPPKSRPGKPSAPKAANNKQRANEVVLEGPLLNIETVRKLHEAELKSAWLVEPKGPLSNYFLLRNNSHTGLGAGGNKFTHVKGVCEGVSISRWVMSFTLNER